MHRDASGPSLRYEPASNRIGGSANMRPLETGAGWLMVLVVVVVIDLGVGGSEGGERLPTNRADTIGVARS